jgi:outer membrane cobalamin receptor
VFFKNGKKGAITCEAGMFEIELLPKLPDTLIVRGMGYHVDTIPISKKEKTLYLEIQLLPDHILEEVVIRQKRDNSAILRLDPRNTETLNSGELRKAACCNLSESFETNATVDVNIPDGVSGAKRIAMMGLDGAYTQIQFENIPILQNLDLPYGLLAIPGTWINSIQITKGTGTVVNGYESMAGLINVEYHKPDDMEKLYLNGYGSIQGRGELNVHYAHQLNDKWSTALFGHYATTQREIDRNTDNFRDIQIGDAFVFLNRWKYKSENFIQQFGIKGNYSDKLGGELGYKRGMEFSDNPLYGTGVQNTHVEVFGKSGWMIKDKPYRSFALLYYGKYHDLDVVFGRRYLQADEKRGYLNFMYEDIIGSTAHIFKTGASFVYDDLRQVQEDFLPTGEVVRELNRTEIVPGVYGEYTYTGMRTTLVAGLRNDYHNLFGNQFTPRANYKYKLTEDMDIRVTAGRGFRVPNYAVDKLSMLATNVPWVVGNDIQPEVSWNGGASWYYQFKLFGNKAILSADYYHTLFTNQLIADRDEDPTVIIFDNLDGSSFSNVVQVDFRFTPLRNLEVKTAYKFTDVRATMGGELMERLMVPRHRGFINTAYTTRNKRWEFDATFSVFSQQRLAQVILPDQTLSQDNRGGVVPLLHGQITHNYKKWEFYIGGENLLDYRLNNPLVDAENPFGNHFDATRVWAPIVGINVYAGFRYTP